MKTQLLCTFATTTTLTTTVDTIVEAYDIVYSKIFVLKDIAKEDDLMCTYNIEAGNAISSVSSTISLHRKKNTNTLYTINALNEAIKTNNNGLLDKTYQLDWNIYRDCILLVNEAGLKRVDTAIKEIIRIKTK